MKAGLYLLLVLMAGCAVRVAPGKADPAVAYRLTGDSLRLSDALNSTQQVRITKVVERDSSVWVWYKRGLVKPRADVKLDQACKRVFFADQTVVR